MQVAITELAALVHGCVVGSSTRTIRAARPLQQAGPDDVSFLESERHVKDLSSCRAGVLVIPQGIIGRVGELAGPEGHPFEFIAVDDPLTAFVAIFRHLSEPMPAPPTGIDPRASIDPTARIGPGCTIMPFAVVGPNAVVGANSVLHAGVNVGANCRLGEGVTLHPQVVLYPGMVLGHRVIVHAHAVIGADGFGYRFVKGQHAKVPQLGNVEIGDDVEIGAGTTIDCGTFQSTVIGAGTKIDNLVQIGHNCRIGRHNIICGVVAMAGSCVTGDYVVLAGGVGVADHVTIGDRAVVGGRSAVPTDVAADQRVVGYPARPERESFRIIASMSHLPEMLREVRHLKQQVATLLPNPGEQERKAG